MTIIRFESEELDQPSLEYLQEARDREGRGLPGIYLDSSQAKLHAASLPWWALGCGPAVLILTLLVTWGSLSSPTNVAFLMTAGVFLGGWMVVAWLRCLIARGRNDYLGHFKYIDPLYIWYATGRGVELTPIAALTRADVHHNHGGEGNYKSSVVAIHLANGRAEVEVADDRRAELLAAYLNELAEVRRGTPAERGYEAIDRLRDGDREGARRVEAIPEPYRARASLWWLRYLVLVGSVVPLFFLCKSVVLFSRDQALFAAVKDKGHADIRVYLQDPNNTRHRDELMAKLARVHEDHAARFESSNVPNAEVKAGLKGVILGLKNEVHPAVTVRFYSSGKGDADPGKHFSDAFRKTLNAEQIKKLHERLTRRISSNDLLNFADVSDPPAVIDVDAVLTLPAGDVPGGQARIDWTVTFQANADAPKTVAKLSATAPAGTDRAAVARQLYGRFADQLLPD